MSEGDWSKKSIEKMLLEAQMPSDEKTDYILKTLMSHPDSSLGALPPAGYEAHLLSSLRMKLPLQKMAPAAPKQSDPWARLNTWIISTRVSWALTGAMALFVLVFLGSQRMINPGAEAGSEDLFAATVLKGTPGDVQGWLASVSDASVRRGLSAVGPDSIVEGLSPKEQRRIEKTLKSVAEKMGVQL